MLGKKERRDESKEDIFGKKVRMKKGVRRGKEKVEMCF